MSPVSARCCRFDSIHVERTLKTIQTSPLQRQSQKSAHRGGISVQKLTAVAIFKSSSQRGSYWKPTTVTIELRFEIFEVKISRLFVVKDMRSL